MVNFTILPLSEMEKRRRASVEALRIKDREKFSEWYQEKCDKLYWQNGPCCAGCDHWQSDSSLTGRCTNAPILSGQDVMRSIGAHFSSYTPPPGHPFTEAQHKCGMFKDDFDWSTLDAEYLKRIGAPAPLPQL